MLSFGVTLLVLRCVSLSVFLSISLKDMVGVKKSKFKWIPEDIFPRGTDFKEDMKFKGGSGTLRKS